jgi:alpha-tubulin suppressor-like RCC1 family protein
VRCWSATETREARYVGNGSTVGCGAPWLVEGLTGVRSLHQGTWATCAVRTGEAVPVWCWGYNYLRQLGSAGPDPLRPAEAPIPAEGLVMGGGSGFSIAPGGAGVVTAWGNNQWGQLGDGTREPDGSFVGVAPHVVSLPGLQQLSIATQTACGVFTGAEVRCWGKGETGQFGAAMLPVAPETRSSTPVLVPGINRAVDVRLDGTSVCALRDDATVWCWGRELFPTGRYRVNLAPRQVVDRATQLVMAGASCALRDDTTVWCWTYIPGPDERTSEIQLVQVPGLMGVRRLYAGQYTTCAWMGGADLRCWGQELGVAGAGSLGFSTTPVRIVF